MKQTLTQNRAARTQFPTQLRDQRRPHAHRGVRCRAALKYPGRHAASLVSFLRHRDKPARSRRGNLASPGETTTRVDVACMMLALVRAIMRWSALLILLAVGACGSTAKPGPDGGGGSNAGGATGGGGRGGSAGSAGGQSGRGGTGGCAPNQVWCPGCEPGTGACYSGGCPGVACPPPDGGAGA